MRNCLQLKILWFWQRKIYMHKLIVHIGSIVFLNPPECLGTVCPDKYACHFWRLRGGMPRRIILWQQRDVASSLLPNSYASTAKKTKVERVRGTTPLSSFGASSSGKATNNGGRYSRNLHQCLIPQDLDHACSLGPGARSARLLFSVLRLKRFGLSALGDRGLRSTLGRP